MLDRVGNIEIVTKRLASESGTEERGGQSKADGRCRNKPKVSSEQKRGDRQKCSPGDSSIPMPGQNVKAPCPP